MTFPERLDLNPFVEPEQCAGECGDGASTVINDDRVSTAVDSSDEAVDEGIEVETAASSSDSSSVSSSDVISEIEGHADPRGHNIEDHAEVRDSNIEEEHADTEVRHYLLTLNSNRIFIFIDKQNKYNFVRYLQKLLMVTGKDRLDWHMSICHEYTKMGILCAWIILAYDLMLVLLEYNSIEPATGVHSNPFKHLLS